MNVNPYAVDSVKQKPFKETDASSGGNAPERPPDTVSFSAEAELIRDAGRRIKAMPDVREDVVVDIKKRIDTGSYKIDYDKLASKMVRETLLDVSG